MLAVISLSSSGYRPACRSADRRVTEKHMIREDAYAVCSVAVDFSVTQPSKAPTSLSKFGGE